MLGKPRDRRADAGSSVGATVYSDRAIDQYAQHRKTNVVEAFEVQAPLPGPHRAEPLQQLWIPVLNAAHEVQNEVGLSR
jgi:hypothetical protein